MSRYETIQIGWELLCGRMWHPNGVRTLSASPSQILDPHMRADYTYMPPKKPGSRRSRTSIRELTLSQEPGLPRLRPSTSIFKLQAGLGSLIPTLLLTICFTFPLLSIVAQLSMWPPLRPPWQLRPCLLLWVHTTLVTFRSALVRQLQRTNPSASAVDLSFPTSSQRRLRRLTTLPLEPQPQQQTSSSPIGSPRATSTVSLSLS